MRISAGITHYTVKQTIRGKTNQSEMDNSIATALISGGGSVLIAITALILSYRGFASLDARFSSLDVRFSSLDARFSSLEGRFGSLEGRFNSLETRMDTFEARIDARLNSMQADMKDLNKTMTALEIDVALVKDKVGL
jgi:flagellar capping protein FliD